MELGAIVVGTDDSPTARFAVEHAIAMAQSSGARLHIVGAARPAPLPVGVESMGATSVGIVEAERVRADLGDAVAADVARARDRGVDAHAHSGVAPPADLLLRVADDVGADLIVVGSKGLGGAGRLLGSVPDTVARKASCNVLIVRTTPARRGRTGHRNGGR